MNAILHRLRRSELAREAATPLFASKLAPTQSIVVSGRLA